MKYSDIELAFYNIRFTDRNGTHLCLKFKLHQRTLARNDHKYCYIGKGIARGVSEEGVSVCWRVFACPPLHWFTCVNVCQRMFEFARTCLAPPLSPLLRASELGTKSRSSCTEALAHHEQE